MPGREPIEGGGGREMSAIRIKKSWEIPQSAATPEPVYVDRRQVLRGLGLGLGAAAIGAAGVGWPDPARAQTISAGSEPFALPALGAGYADRFPAQRSAAHRDFPDRRETPQQIASRYNNFYEFTTDKDRVWELAAGYPVDPWRIEVRGLVKRQRSLDLDDIFTRFPLEERLYRFRCVERWSAQIPWTGYPLRRLIDLLEPLPSARYVRFVTRLDAGRMPGVSAADGYPWPYAEALRLDEARHELAMVVVGSYGHALPMQHGAPWRVVAPWKYGYKSPKSIVTIELTKKRPATFWNQAQPAEYGFFSNVDPSKPHPRWSQRFETDIGSRETRETLLLNGYADAVGGIYDGAEV